jgi:uncharacterized cupin superfamily protein
MPRPVVFAALANVELNPAPIDPAWIVEGTPQARSKEVARSADGSSAVMIWSCTPGVFTWRYKVDEALHVVSGEAFVTDGTGEIRRMAAGDVVFFPAGSVSTWRITEELKKVAVCRHALPRPVGLLVRIWTNLFSRMTGFEEGLKPSDEPCEDGQGNKQATGVRVVSA